MITKTPITDEKLADRITDPDTDVTIEKTTDCLCLKGGERVRRQVFQVEFTEPLDE